MNQVWTNHYLDGNGDPLEVECVLDLKTAIDFAANRANYAFTVHVADHLIQRIHLGTMISEYLAEQADERRYEMQEVNRGRYAL